MPFKIETNLNHYLSRYYLYAKSDRKAWSDLPEAQKTALRAQIDQRYPICTHDDFPVGARVQVVARSVDFFYFRGTEQGKVIKNSGGYLGIIVQFDEPLIFEDGTRKTSHNFNPADLICIDALPSRKRKPARPNPLAVAAQLISDGNEQALKDAAPDLIPALVKMIHHRDSALEEYRKRDEAEHSTPMD